MPWIRMGPLELEPRAVPWSHPRSVDPEVSPGAADVQEAIDTPRTYRCSVEPFPPHRCPLCGAAATPRPHFSVPPNPQSPTLALAVLGWFPSQPCSRLLFMAHPDPLQSGGFTVWLNRLRLWPWEEGPCPPCDYTPALTTRTETQGTRGHTQICPTASCSHGNGVPRPPVPSPEWPLPKAGQPGPVPRLIQPANPPVPHVLGTRGHSGAGMWHPGVGMWHRGLPGTHQAGGVVGCPVQGALGFGVLGFSVPMSPRGGGCARVPARAMAMGVHVCRAAMSLFPQAVSPRAHVSLCPHVSLYPHVGMWWT